MRAPRAAASARFRQRSLFACVWVLLFSASFFLYPALSQQSGDGGEKAQEEEKQERSRFPTRVGPQMRTPDISARFPRRERLPIEPKLTLPKKKTPITGGYVMSHEHPAVGMAFGGNYAFAGAAGNYVGGVMEDGFTATCGGCQALGNCDHGEVKGSFTAATGSLGGDMGDHASHAGPKYDSFSHIRYSTEWFREAARPTRDDLQDTRMKIMVAFAVDNEAMCEQLYDVNKNNGGPGGQGFPCSHGDSVASMERQINAIKAWVNRNADWAEIALSAAEVRRIVGNDKLAVILGVESDYAFGAEDRNFDPVDRLNRYYNLGVRTFYLAHKINSRLSGSDIYFSGASMPGKAIRATQAIAGCFYYDDAVGQYPLYNDKGHNFCDNNCGDGYLKGNKFGGLSDACINRYGEISEVNMLDYVTRGNGQFNGFAIYPDTPGFDRPGGSHQARDAERNNLGLSHDGERVVRAAMLKGMIVNIDHVSSRARLDMKDISEEFETYPLNALHNNPNSRLIGDNYPHEYDFDDQELEIIKDTGGFFGVRLGPIDSVEYPASGVTDNCPKTSTESAKIIAYLMEEHGLNIGYSLDLATVTQGVYSRTKQNCARDLGTDDLHQDEAHIVDGLTHIGMMSRWHKELETIGLDEKFLEPLKNDQAEAFVQMWEWSEYKADKGQQIERIDYSDPSSTPERCSEDSDCGAENYCNTPVVGKRSCQPLKDNGTACTSPRQCDSGRCNLGFCAASDACQSDTECANDQFCGNPVAGRRTCKDRRDHGQACTVANQCSTGRCSWGFCADPDECQSNSDCASAEFCGDPVSGKRKCKTLRTRGQACTSAQQCSSDRCSWGVCADSDECRSGSECTSGEFCGDPVAGKRTCKSLRPHGQACTSASQCVTGRCSWGFCADPDECQSNSDCSNSQFCGDPVAGKRKCKALKSHGQTCTAARQCATGRCLLGFCADQDECNSDTNCSSSEYCANPVTGKRRCKSLRSSGAACTKPKQCASGKCPFPKMKCK